MAGNRDSKDHRHPKDYSGDDFQGKYPLRQVHCQYPHGRERVRDGTPKAEVDIDGHMPSGSYRKVFPDGTTMDCSTGVKHQYSKQGHSLTIEGLESGSGKGSASNEPNAPGRGAGGNHCLLNNGGNRETLGGPASKNCGKEAGEYKTAGGPSQTVAGGGTAHVSGGKHISANVGDRKVLTGKAFTQHTGGAGHTVWAGGHTEETKGASPSKTERHHGSHVRHVKGKASMKAGSQDSNIQGARDLIAKAISHSAGGSASYSGGSSASLSSGGSTSVSGQSTSVSGSSGVSISSGSGGSGGGMSANSSGVSVGQGNTAVAANSSQITTNGNVVANGTVTLGNTIFTGTLAVRGYDLQSALINNFSYTVANTVSLVVFNISGVFGKGTVTMPPAPVDGQVVGFTTSNTMTVLTINANAGQAVLGAPTTMTTITPFRFEWINSLATWFRV